jgi:hypothetical protein
VVVRTAITKRRRARRVGRLLWRVALVLVNIALLPTYSGGISRSSHAQGVLTVDELGSIPRLAVGRLAGVSQFRALGRQSFANLVSPSVSPSTISWFAIESLDSNLRVALGLDSRAPLEGQGFDLLSRLDSAVETGTDELGISGGPTRPVPGSVTFGKISVACTDNQLETQLQGGGEFWTGQARSVVPVQFPLNVFTANSRGNADPLTLGPTGYPINLPAMGPAGGWCRPHPLPMSQSSPLEYRALWIAVLFPLAVALVYWLSRGFRIRPLNEE